MIAGARLLFCYDGSSFNAIMYMQYSRKPMTGATRLWAKSLPSLWSISLQRLPELQAAVQLGSQLPIPIPGYKRNKPKKQLIKT
jgi:hypothetical protein